MLDGPKADYHVPLPAPGERKRAIMDSFTKEHSAEYQSQALIDLAFRMRETITDFEQIEKIVIHTSHHTHYVIGTGANDPQKMDPKASRETLDHSIMYIFAVALQDGKWHHVDSYTSKRAGRADTVGCGTKSRQPRIPNGPVAIARPIRMNCRSAAASRSSCATARSWSTKWRSPTPIRWAPNRSAAADYIGKFLTLTDGIVSAREASRFLEAAQSVASLPAGELHQLNVALPAGTLAVGKPGII